MQPWVSCQVQCTVRSTTLNIPIPAVFASLASLLPRSSRVFLYLSLSLSSSSLVVCASLFSLRILSRFPFRGAYVRACVRAYTLHARVRTDTRRQKPLYASLPPPSLILSLPLFSPSVPSPRDRCVFLRAAVVGRPEVRGAI